MMGEGDFTGAGNTSAAEQGDIGRECFVILEGTGGWSDRIRDIAYKGKHLDEGGTAELHYANTPAEAVDLALSLAPRGETGKTIEREFRS